jgi:hypothetical protein
MKSIILTISLFLSISLLAQNNKKPASTPASKSVSGPVNELDNTYTPLKNSLFDENAKKNEQYSSYSVDFNNAIKFNPFLLVRSTIAFGYERKLVGNLTGSIFLGYNYKRDWIQTMGAVVSSGEGELLSSSASEIGLASMLASGIYKGGGIYSSFGLKLYTEDTPFEGSYFEIQTRFNNYTLDLGVVSNDLGYDFAPGTATDVKIKNTSGYLIWGSQFCTSGTIKATHEFYTGVGIRSTSYDVFNYSDVDSGIGSTNSFITNTGNRENTLGFSFIMGYIFGIGF